uniref:lysozyme n=1 Tax=Bactrocera latifrons TaxID=174628 RepID=A0A0K8WLU1_BACLA
MSTRSTRALRVRNDAPCVFALVARIFCMLVAFSGSVNAKVYDRCELAQVLHNRHRLDLHEVATWTCIAQHSSGFNTEAYASGLSGGSHGLFQISDVFWCSPPGKGFACNLPCERLRDADLTDDLRCLRIIYDEHQRLSGDGYNAWNAYQQFCRHGVESYVADCFPNQSKAPVAQQTFTHTAFASAPAPYYTSNDLTVHTNSINNGYSTHKRGKIYDRCELAQELYYKHKMPMEQIPTWVCIAQHESNFDTSAVGRLNADGSADHGLFQISDLYWCSHDRYSGGKACGLQCTKLLDNDISDDVRCIKRIHGEHTRISGDGFTAWSVYNRDCRNQQYSVISTCFQEPPLQHAAKTHVQTAPSHTFPSIQAHPAFPQTSLQPQFQSNPFLQHIGVPQESKQTLQKHHQHKYTSPKIVTQTHNPQTHKGYSYVGVYRPT